MKNLLKNLPVMFSHENTICAVKNVFTNILILFILTGCFTIQGCKNTTSQNLSESSWKEEFQKRLPLVGHRNWILIVDKAFPLQSSSGIHYFNTNDSLPAVLDYVVKEIGKSSHLEPVVYLDQELDFIPKSGNYSPQNYKTTLREILKDKELKVIPHDSVFRKVDATSKLFTVLVLKTEQTIPYSSVFIELGCKYWNQESENKLRLLMKESLEVKK